MVARQSVSQCQVCVGIYLVQQHSTRVIPLPHFRLRFALLRGLPHLQPNSCPTLEELLDCECFTDDEGCGLCDLSRAKQTLKLEQIS